MKTKLAHLSMTIITIAFLSGCASGPRYGEVRSSGIIAPPSDKALLIIYWPNSLAEGQGNKTKVYANDLLIQPKLRPGSFCFYYADPGPLRISSGAYNSTKADYVASGIAAGAIGVMVVEGAQKKDMVEINAVAGQTYYVETHNGELHEKMHLMPSADGEKNVQKCHWLGLSQSTH
jgi:hypothetical protein